MLPMGRYAQATELAHMCADDVGCRQGTMDGAGDHVVGRAVGDYAIIGGSMVDGCTVGECVGENVGKYVGECVGSVALRQTTASTARTPAAATASSSQSRLPTPQQWFRGVGLHSAATAQAAGERREEGQRGSGQPCEQGTNRDLARWRPQWCREHGASASCGGWEYSVAVHDNNGQAAVAGRGSVAGTLHTSVRAATSLTVLSASIHNGGGRHRARDRQTESAAGA